MTVFYPIEDISMFQELVFVIVVTVVVVVVVILFYFLSKKYYLQNILQFLFAIINSFSILTLLQNV